jgi:DNA-binding response OmpR family regulator
MPANRVLCIEDDEDTRDMAQDYVGFSELEAVVAAPDASAALRLMEREQFSFHLLDGGLRRATGSLYARRFARPTPARPS